MENLEELYDEKNIKEYINLKYKYDCRNIYYDPIILETLNNKELYNFFIKPIINIDRDECFDKIIDLVRNYPKMEKNNKLLIKNLISKAKVNYQSFYYNNLMLFYFEMLITNYKLSLENLIQIIEYFIGKESFDNNLNVDFNIIKINDVIKNILKFDFYLDKGNFSKQNLKIAINNKKKLLKKYKTSFGCQKYTEELKQSVIEINIFNFNKFFFDKNLTFQVLIDVIYHEIRHAFQISGNNLKLKNEYERTNVLSYDYDFYLKNHDYIFTEVDADLYSLEKRKELFGKYFYVDYLNERKYKEKKCKILVDYYNKKIEINKKVDILLINNKDILKNDSTLNLEYENTGYPKDIFSVLNSKVKNNNIVYDEIIVRCLNRLSEESYIETIKNLKEYNLEFLDFIDNALINKIKEINEHLIFLEENYKEKYEYKVIPYTSKIYFYYIELLKIKKQNRVDKIYSK